MQYQSIRVLFFRDNPMEQMWSGLNIPTHSNTRKPIISQSSPTPDNVIVRDQLKQMDEKIFENKGKLKYLAVLSSFSRLHDSH